MGLAELLDLRGDGLAGTAPGGEEVDEHGLGGVDDLGLPVSLAVRLLVSALYYFERVFQSCVGWCCCCLFSGINVPGDLDNLAAGHFVS